MKEKMQQRPSTAAWINKKKESVKQKTGILKLSSHWRTKKKNENKVKKAYMTLGQHKKKQFVNYWSTTEKRWPNQEGEKT